MKPPQFPVAPVVVFVAFAALNFAAIRAWSHFRVGHGIGTNGRSVTYINNTFDEMGVGALPMANVLAIGLLPGQRRRGNRSFRLGFELFGTVALGCFLALAYFYTDDVIQPYVLWFLRLGPLQRFGDTLSPVVRAPFFDSVTMLLDGLPQFAFALMGGLFFHWARIFRPRERVDS